MQVEHRSTLGRFPTIFVFQDGSNKQELMLVLNIWQYVISSIYCHDLPVCFCIGANVSVN
jgi:hypothetical protein